MRPFLLEDLKSKDLPRATFQRRKKKKKTSKTTEVTNIFYPINYKQNCQGMVPLVWLLPSEHYKWTCKSTSEEPQAFHYSG